MKTAELTGAALDWAVAKCEGIDTFPYALPGGFALYSPSTAWKDGGPLIEREGLGVTQHNNIPDRPDNRWQCVKYQGGMLLGNAKPLCAFGPTPLIAAMRCYVASKLGDEVEIPEELK